MNNYEITYLVDPQLERDQRDELDSKIDVKITDSGGKIEHSEPIEHRNLAYPIDNKRTAFYRAIQVTLKESRVKDIETYLKKEKKVMRAVILATPKRERAKQETIDKHTRKKEKSPKMKNVKKEEKPKKKVTMKSVEKGIEQALSGDVE